VIGVGNAYRSDDGVGLIVAQRLMRESFENVTVREASGEGAALIDMWKEAGSVILIDAVRSGARPGTVHKLDAGAEPIPARFLYYSTHAFGVAEAIELARTLNQLPPNCTVYGIEGHCFTAGIGLSPEVESAAREVVERVMQDLREDVHVTPAGD
jgi:hydrogenase maturation protease